MILLVVIITVAFGVFWADRGQNSGQSAQSGTEATAEGGGNGSAKEASDAEGSD